MPTATIQFLILASVPILSPGPAVFLTVTNTLHFGPRAGLISAIGNGTATVTVGLLIGLGLGHILSVWPKAVAAIQAVSALYLFYLGYRFATEHWRRFIRSRLSRADIGRATFFNSLFLGLSNPAGIIFFSAAIPLFLDRDANILDQTLSLVLSYGAACTACHMLLILFCSFVRKHFQRPRTAIAIRRCTGVLFIGLSIFVFANAAVHASSSPVGNTAARAYAHRSPL